MSLRAHSPVSALKLADLKNKKEVEISLQFSRFIPFECVTNVICDGKKSLEENAFDEFAEYDRIAVDHYLAFTS